MSKGGIERKGLLKIPLALIILQIFMNYGFYVYISCLIIIIIYNNIKSLQAGLPIFLHKTNLEPEKNNTHFTVKILRIEKVDPFLYVLKNHFN